MTCCKDENSLGRIIYFTAQNMKNFAEKTLSPFDLTLEQFHLLKHMATDTGLSQRELGGIANKTPANMTRILDRLEDKKLVQRCDNPLDRRASLVFLTKKGQKQVAEVLEIFESFSDKFLKGVTKKDEQIVRDALNKIQNNILKMTEKI